MGPVNLQYRVRSPLATVEMVVVNGFLLDVSGSMKEVWSNGVPGENTKIHVIFETLKKFVKYAKERNLANNLLFVEVFGLNLQSKKSCDLIFLIDLYLQNNCTKFNPCQKVLNWISRNVCEFPVELFPTIVADISGVIQEFSSGKRALEELVRKKHYLHIITWLPCIEKESDAMFLFCALARNPKYIGKFASMISPVASIAMDGAQKGADNLFSFLSPFQSPQQASQSKFTEEKKKEIARDSEAYRFAMKIATEYVLPATKLHKVGDVIDLLKRFETVEDSVDGFFTTFERTLFGKTPLQETMQSTMSLFATVQSNDKNLFILSDGESTDGDPYPVAALMKSQRINIVTCFLTAEAITQPRKLFCNADNSWSTGEKTLFRMSSERSLFDSPLSSLQRIGWTLPSEGDCKLFVRVNSPEVVREFCALVFNQMTSESMDVVVDFVSTAIYSEYVNSYVSNFGATKQSGPICYAHAIAAVFVLAMSRIIGRVASATDSTQSYPTFETVRDSIILRDANGDYTGTSSQEALERMAAKYRLHYNEVDENGARQALLKGRPVVARFHLNAEDWKIFRAFFTDKDTRTPLETLPVGSMKLRHCTCENKSMCQCGGGGHAVVLVRCSKDSLTFLNSWGDTWADRGMFKIANSNCLGSMKFYDVFWRTDDLFPIEIANYERKKRETAAAYLADSATVRDTVCQCPPCAKNYKVCEYKGTFDNAICPLGHHFRSNDGFLRAFLWMSEEI